MNGCSAAGAPVTVQWYESVSLRPQPDCAPAAPGGALAEVSSSVSLSPSRDGSPSSSTGLPTDTLIRLTGAGAATGWAMPMRACGVWIPHSPTGTSGTLALVANTVVLDRPVESVTMSCTSYSPERSGTRLGVGEVGFRISAALPGGALARLHAYEKVFNGEQLASGLMTVAESETGTFG